MEDRWVLGACGLNCGVCDIYRAGRGDVEKQMETVRWFKEKRGLDVPPEKIRCDGCAGDLSRHWSEDCGMMLCARERGLKLCSDCPDFVCGRLEAFAGDGMGHHRRTVENLRRIREMGLEAWLEEQRARGPPVFCP